MKNLQKPLLNPKSAQLIERHLKNPTHALLLSGPNGVGLTTAAKYIAKTLAGPEVVIIKPSLHDKQKTANINVKDLKVLHEITRDKRTAPLVIIIDQADKLTHQAPEAFLKLLEEPGRNIHFILTSHRAEKLPATALSRLQKIEILPLPSELYGPLLEGIKPEAKRQQIEFMAQGLPAEIIRLRDDDEYFRARSIYFEKAKNYLGGGKYQRLEVVPSLKNRAEAIEFVETLAKLTELLALKTDKSQQISILSQVLDNLHANGNLKAQLTHLALNY